ncbi:MAG TPA: serine hydrolase [Chitinophagaceae bacterium]|jgi:CubicO group peptidase (beta-lactamase class C family)|nr:serine hydrolase [Chitinophagaceae bacterium]
MNSLRILIAGMIIFSNASFSQSSHFQTEKLDSFVAKAMNDWHLMSLAVAVVKKDSLIFAKGYGYRDLFNKLPVTENTSFPIASVSKTFTTALIGIAEKEGKLQLNKPVHQYFPGFELYTDQLTNNVTAEDMLSHRTGVAGHDWAWTFNTNFPESVYLKRLKYLEPFAPMRTEFQYSNFMFFALSVLAGKLYNTTWNDLVSKELFQPLEMKNTHSSYKSINDFSNVALKYEYKDSFKLEKAGQMDDLLGAGSINSTASDLARWLQVWINGGMYKGKEIIPPGFVKRATESHFVADGSINPKFPDEYFYNLGYCWFLSSYRGHYQAQHTGNLDGFSSSVTFFPLDSLGIVVLANQNGSTLIQTVPDLVADLAFDLPVRDKNSVYIKMRKRYDSSQQKLPKINVDTITSKPLFSLEKYTGNFQNPGYGPLKIEVYKKALLLTYYDLELVLVPKEGHRFSSHYKEEDIASSNGVGDVVFHFDKQGKLKSFQIPFEPTVKDIVFKKE